MFFQEAYQKLPAKEERRLRVRLLILFSTFSGCTS